MPDVYLAPETEASPPAATGGAWLGWREPRSVEGVFEHPYHHALIEVQIPGDGESRAVCPIDLPQDSRFDRIVWRPMPWGVEGGQNWRYFGTLEPECVFQGKDDHLFYRLNLACEQIFEGGGLTDEGCRKWIELLRRRLDWCNARNILYRMVVIPENHAIYHDRIAGSPPLSPLRPIMRLLATADEDVRNIIIYPLDVMRAGRTRHETSYPHDVHFTRYGAFLCYREIMRDLPGFTPERVVREEDLTRKTATVAGDVARAFGSPARIMEWFDPPPIEMKTIFKTSAMTNNQVDVFGSNEHSLPKLVMFRTSNSGQLFPFLMRHFSRLTAVSGMRVFYDLLESEAPNVVLTEIPERYIAGRGPRWPGDRDCCNAPDESTDSSFAEALGHTLPLPR